MSTTGFRISVQDQENKKLMVAHKGNIMNSAYKGNIVNSARKPLGDRGVNQTPSTSALKVPQKVKIYEEPKKIKTPIKKIEISDWYTNVCSHNDEMYDDFIYPKSERINVSKFMKTILEPKTPPFNTDFNLMPNILESPPKNDFYIYEEDFVPEVDVLELSF